MCDFKLITSDIGFTTAFDEYQEDGTVNIAAFNCLWNHDLPERRTVQISDLMKQELPRE